jgi:hypothetical protein
MSYVHPDIVKLYVNALKLKLQIVGQFGVKDGVLIRLFDKNRPQLDCICCLFPRSSNNGVNWKDIIELNKACRKAIRRITKPKHKEKAKKRQIKLQARKQREVRIHGPWINRPLRCYAQIPAKGTYCK